MFSNSISFQSKVFLWKYWNYFYGLNDTIHTFVYCFESVLNIQIQNISLIELTLIWKKRAIFYGTTVRFLPLANLTTVFGSQTHFEIFKSLGQTCRKLSCLRTDKHRPAPRTELNFTPDSSSRSRTLSFETIFLSKLENHRHSGCTI